MITIISFTDKIIYGGEQQLTKALADIFLTVN